MANSEKNESDISPMETSETNFTLEDCFEKIIEGKSLEIDLSNANTILKKGLVINLSSLKPKVISILPYMFIHFIKSWPGWQKSNNYFNKQITFQSWFEKFKEYLIFKINFLIKNLDKVIVDNSLLDDNFLMKIDDSVQTSSVTEKGTAPFILEVQGPPRMLNSLVFCEGIQETITLKEYNVNALWSDMLSIRQLINWPCIEIEFKSEELHFKRNNLHDFKRFLTFSSEKLLFNKPENMIEEVCIMDENISRQAYTLNAVKEYCNLYISVLRKHQSHLTWTDRYLDQIETILEDFILDIVDINMNSIATNTSILFNIGNSIYARNKSIRTSDQAVCLTDSITPKMLLSVLNFTAIKDPTSSVPFSKLQKLFDNYNKDILFNSLPTITYECTYCAETYGNNIDVWMHLKSAHSMEQPVLCFRCKKQFKISDLTENRWRHQCNTRTSSEKDSDQTRCFSVR